MSFAEEEERAWGTEGQVPQGANEGLALLQGDPGKEEQDDLFEDTHPRKAGPRPGLGCLSIAVAWGKSISKVGVFL